ncbi:hypothetical protein M407DRAFT_25261 [Tulasnella calospora MUT 4182]|uniref:FAR1 domain-containing protein n=1 Tax=Tulasnella calospora MUT 4182 TaxID=1051891 RepID=A0A0C3QGI5_9AGAM|nr:hypothetical protein M407DRAFT_25261 [Tulasnella calospora MUT 4182]
MEVAYLQLAARSSQPSPIILPTRFTLSLLQLYYQEVKQFNFECLALPALLRKRVLSNTFVGFSFVFCNDIHYTSFYYDGESTLHFGDSLSSAPGSTASRIVPALNWFLNGTNLPLVEDVRMMDISYQGAASRSCGIASFNGVERLVQMPDVEKWEPAAASSHRERHLMDILRHATHAASYQSTTLWYSEVADVDEPSIASHVSLATWENSYAWSCWNIPTLHIEHPFLSIYRNISPDFALHPVYDLCLAHTPSCTPSRSSSAPQTPRAHTRYVLPGTRVNSANPHCHSAHQALAWPSPQPLSSARQHHQLGQAETPPPHTLPPQVIDLSGLPSSSPMSSSRTVTPHRQIPVHVLSDSDVDSPVKPQPIKKSRPVVVDLVSDDDVTQENNVGQAQTQTPSSQKPRPRVGCANGSNHRRIGGAVLPIAEGDTFSTVEEAIQAITDEAETTGFVMRRGEQKLCNDGITIKKVTLRCQSYGLPSKHHDLRVHPADLWKGKTNRTGCKAHVNINRVQGSSDYHVTTIDNNHNHPRVLAVGGKAQRPPSAAHKSIVAKYADEGFNRQQIM